MKFRAACRALAFSSVFASIGANAWSARLERSQISFQQILSPNSARINAIVRDGRGFLWFGTTKGLFKYDGYQVRVFPGASPLDGLVFSILKAGEGSLVLGTGNGLLRFDLTTEQAAPFLRGMPFSESKIVSLAKDSAGTLWIGTGSLGVFSYNPSTRKLRQYTKDTGLGSNGISTILPGQGNMLWIGTGAGGLTGLDRTTGGCVRYQRNVGGRESLNSNHITALCEREGRELWIGTDRGLNVLDLASGHIRALKIPSAIEHTVMSIACDPSGRVWIAATDLGLLSYSDGEFTPFKPSNDVGRSLNTILTLYPDPVATTTASLLLWVGTHTGVDKVLIAANPFTNHIRGEQSLQLNRGAVLALSEDRKGILWVGLWGGGMDALQRVQGGYRRIAHLEHDALRASSLPYNDVEDIMEDSKGNLWIGTLNGLGMLAPGRNHLTVDRHVDEDSTSLAGNVISRIFQDHTGTIWVCTGGGVSQLIPGSVHRFKNFLNLPRDSHAAGGNEVSDLLEDSLSNLWMATSGNGLIKRDPGGVLTRFLAVEDSSGTLWNWIYTLALDRNGLFWLSTRGGLMSFDCDSRKFARRNIDKLHEEHIFGIETDQRNNLWLATSIGLCRLNQRTGAFTTYESADGLLFSEFFSRFFRNKRGTFFLGGLDGFTEFCPESIATARTAPAIAITGLSVFDRALPATVFGAPSVDLAYDQKSFSFSFAALDYADPTRNSYAYRMMGLDTHWIDVGHRTYAGYTNMDPGTYVFQVKGSNSNDVWNEAGTSITMVISPPYWRTWWFRSAAVLFTATMIYSAYRYRVRRLLDLERLRLRIANDLHDDVGSNLSAIAMVSRALHRTPELSGATRQKLEEIYDTAVLTSEGMKDLVWLIKPENDTLDDLFLRMKDTASALLGEIPFAFHAPDAQESKAVGIDFKRSVFLAFKEIITNIAKHSGASNVEIQIALHDRLFEMVISDNGQGFDPFAPPRGNGMQSLHARAEHIGGSCKIQSSADHGTRVTFSARL